MQYRIFIVVLMLVIPFLAAEEQKMEPRRAAVHATEFSLPKSEPIPEWQIEIETKLQKEVSLEYTEIPIANVLIDLGKKLDVSMILDPLAIVDDMGAPVPKMVTMQCHKMKAEFALNWIMKLVDLYWGYKDGAVFVSKEDYSECWLKIYDVRNLVKNHKKYSPPYLGVDGSRTPPQVVDGKVVTDSYVIEEDDIDIESLKDLIRSYVAAELWNSDRAWPTMDIASGKLIITAPLRIHSKVERIIEEYRLSTLVQIKVSAQVYSLPEELMSDLLDTDKNKGGTIYLRKGQLDRISAADKGGTARLLEGIHISGFNGQRVYSMSGRPELRDGKPFFFGTKLDVEPVLSFDRKYITMDINFHRATGKEGTIIFKTGLTCLSTDTVMVAGGPLEGAKEPQRLVVLITPEIQNLEPNLPSEGKISTSTTLQADKTE